jgi:hypothetical protein
MFNSPPLAKRLVFTAVVAGFAVAIMYPARTFLPLPDFLGLAFWIFFGPLIVVAFIGFYPFLAKPGPSVAAILGTVFGVIGGLCNMLFAVVQSTNLSYIRRYMGATESAEARALWQDILNGVFTVQNGMNWVSDFFIDWAAFFFAVVMWNHPKFGKAWSMVGFVAAGAHFALKTYSFPVPPAEAGLLDVGPAVSVFFALVTIQVARNLQWLDWANAQRPMENS